MPSRLKHFCQLCRKQCKDENGFKCHVNSSSHQEKVRQYASNPLEHIQRASKQFQGRFVQMLKTKYPGQPKYLQQLYDELMEEKKFLKFNHTQWKNLGQFGQYLQEVRNIKVMGTPPNCKVVYVVHKTKDFVQNAMKQKRLEDRQKQKQQFQKQINSRIEKQKELAERQQNLLNAKLEQLKKESLDIVIPDKLEFNIDGFKPQVKRSALYTTNQIEEEVAEGNQIHTKKMQKIEEMYEQLKKNNKDVEEQEEELEWIKQGITVRIRPHQIDSAFHNKKTKIIKIVEPYIAEVKLGTALIQIDQTNLETVIPKPGHEVMVLSGHYSGQIGVLSEANTQQGFGVVKLGSKDMQIPFNLFSRFDKE